MTPLRFYEHFAVAFGTIWLVMLVLALLTQTNINAGIFGLIGFPILSLIYAFVRKSQVANSPRPPSSGRGET